MAFIAIGQAQAINISGIVKNSGGIGIEGVRVKLGKANIVTTTGSNGSFTLKDNTGIGVKYQSHHAVFRDDCPILLKDDRFFFNRAEQTEVKVMAYDCNGKLLLSRGKVVPGGNYSIPLQHFGSGIQIYRVSVNKELYTFKSVPGIATNRGASSPRKEISLAKQAKVTAGIDDALLFIKAGYKLYHTVMKKTDTSGLQITMAPLDTGTVTDADGNVYRTVRIGNQEWTAENLRTTKYNDGSSIGSGYKFYNNTTDAAAKKKWGALYAQNVVKSSKLAPAGWHVATDNDWKTLQNYLIANGYNYDGTISGNKIAKSMAATTDWEPDSEIAGAIGNDLSLNNASGFSALPAGWWYYGVNDFTGQGNEGYWFTSSGYTYELWWVNSDLFGVSSIVIQCSVRLVRNN